MSSHDDINETEQSIRQKAKGAADLSKTTGPQFSQGENQPVLDADMQPMGDPSRLAEAADVTPGEESE